MSLCPSFPAAQAALRFSIGQDGTDLFGCLEDPLSCFLGALLPCWLFGMTLKKARPLRPRPHSGPLSPLHAALAGTRPLQSIRDLRAPHDAQAGVRKHSSWGCGSYSAIVLLGHLVVILLWASQRPYHSNALSHPSAERGGQHELIVKAHHEGRDDRTFCCALECMSPPPKTPGQNARPNAWTFCQWM